MVNRERMKAQLLLHEGLRLKSYTCTEGYWTVGVGFNMSARGIDSLERIIGRKLGNDLSAVVITRAEALLALDYDIERFEEVIPVHFPFYLELDEVRQRVVLDMAFNMGFGTLGFKNTRKMVEARDWSGAARGMYNSKWARQVGDGPGGKKDRCDRLSGMMLTGRDYTS